DQGSITQDQYDVASNSPNTATVHDRDLDIAAPYAAEWVRQQLFTKYGGDVYSSGYEATTTIDARLQDVATKAVRDGVFRYDRRHGYRGPVGHLALPTDPSEMRVAVQQALVPYPPRVGLEAAVAVSLAPDSFTAMRANGEAVVIKADFYKWARRFV